MSNKKNDSQIEKRKNEILGLFLITFAAISYLAIFSNSAGLLGNYLSNAYYFLVGSGSYFFPLLFIYWGIQFIRSREIKFSSRFGGLLIAFTAIISIINLSKGVQKPLVINFNTAGGIIGNTISYFLAELFAVNGAYIILSVILLIGLLLLFDLFLHNIFSKVKIKIKAIKDISLNFKEEFKSFFANLS
ncbi:MAG: DNA translocase FtsK 4TM domain-containing protein, partial [Bacillota bacterium]